MCGSASVPCGDVTYEGCCDGQTVKFCYADKLDSIGAIGAGRAFHFAGRIGARVHNSEAEARDSDSYSVEDSAYREYLVKLRHIHEAMLTAEGRRMAEGRHLFMVAFFERICLETRGEDFGTG